MFYVGLIFSSIIIFTLCWYYRRHKHELPTLHHVDSDLNRHILKSKPIFTSPYRMPFWLQNTHLHGCISLLMAEPKVTFEREFIKMKDGGVVALDWVMDNFHEVSEQSPVLIILLTWTGSKTGFSGLCQSAVQRGFRVAIFNKRGYGYLTLNTPKLHCIGDPADLKECVEYIHKKYPQANIVGHGSSAGTGTLMSYCIRSQDKCPLTAAVFISPSYNQYRTYSDMPFLYRRFLLLSLKLTVWRHRNVLKSVVDLKAVLFSFDFKSMDRNLYLKTYGYEDEEMFTKDYDPLDKVETLQIPALAISSHDDPICQTNTIPYHLLQDTRYPGRMLVTVPKGGHCGFFEGRFQLESWSDRMSLDYLDAVLEFTGDKK